MTTMARKRLRFELEMPEGWSTFVFLSLMLFIVTGSISEAGYDEGLRALTGVTVGAVFASLFLAKSRLPGILAHLFSLIYGTAWNAFVISYQLPATFSARDKLLEVGYRLADWVQKSVLGGELGTDPLMFTLVMCILAWLLTYFAMWFALRTHNLWAALLPSSLTLMINLYYGPERIGFFIVPYVLLAFLFISRLNLYMYERDWRRHKVRYATDIAYTFLRYGTTVALIAIILAWGVPTAASSERVEVFFSRFSEPWERVKEEWIRLFSTLQSERTQSNFAAFDRSLALGGPVSLGSATLMDVQSIAGRYWRATVYDEYTGEGWDSTATETVFLEAGELPGEMVPFEARRVITQTFTLYMPRTTQLYALNQPERFSVPIKADLLGATSPEGDPWVDSLSMVDSRYTLKGGTSYMVISTIAAADEDAMRLAGEEYPDWIEPYLQLPDDLPQRVRDLAQEITAEYDNAYDKATAIQNYLREYTYNEKIPSPPPGVDRVDYFLFEMKEGYCNYYASSMVVMSRAVGIPARMAAGYTRGEWNTDTKAYRVREHNAHTWVEVYLPRFGWVEFEPTASEELIVRPRVAKGDPGDLENQGQEHWEDYLNREMLQSADQFDPEYFQQLLAEQRRRERQRTMIRVGGVVGISAAIILIAWWQGRRRMDEEKPARTYYERMVRRADWLGCKMQLAQTPNEYAAQLSASLANPEGEKLVHRITDAYVSEEFGRKNPARYQPDFAWRDLRSLLLRWGVGHLWKRLWEREEM
jgi:hypothetical protein